MSGDYVIIKKHSPCKKKALLRFVITLFLVAFVISSCFFLHNSVDHGSRSTDLIVHEIVNGQTKTIYYLDEDGRITFSLDKHYAIIVQKKIGTCIYEEYYDESGVPVKQPAGHYALKKEYDELDKLIQTTYLGIDGLPTANLGGYTYARYEYENESEYIRYYNQNEERVFSPYEGAGRINKCDELGRIIEVVFLDSEDNPSCVKQGYAIQKRSYFDNGLNFDNVEYEYYFDEYGFPVSLSLGQYGVRKEYDKFGRNDVLTFLDSYGMPMKTNQGYVTLKRTFYPDDSVKTEMYFDLNGNPVALSEGQYGIVIKNGNIAYLDSNGYIQRHAFNWINMNPLCVIIIALSIGIVSLSQGKKINHVLLLLYILFVINVTLMHRLKGDSQDVFELFWSYKVFLSNPSLRLEIINNIWLFVPLGTIIYKLCPKVYVLAIPLLISALIEGIQFMTGFGLCEIDDIISNSLGGAIGFSFGYLLDPMLNKAKLMMSFNNMK